MIFFVNYCLRLRFSPLMSIFLNSECFCISVSRCVLLFFIKSRNDKPVSAKNPTSQNSQFLFDNVILTCFTRTLVPPTKYPGYESSHSRSNPPLGRPYLLANPILKNAFSCLFITELCVSKLVLKKVNRVRPSTFTRH